MRAIELDRCVEALEDDEDPPCEGDEVDKPNVCRGVVLDAIFSDNLPG